MATLQLVQQQQSALESAEKWCRDHVAPVTQVLTTAKLCVFDAQRDADIAKKENDMMYSLYDDVCAEMDETQVLVAGAAKGDGAAEVVWEDSDEVSDADYVPPTSDSGEGSSDDDWTQSDAL